MKSRRLLTLAAVPVLTAALSASGWSRAVAVAAGPEPVPIASLPFAQTVAGPFGQTPGGSGTAAGNDAVAARCNGGDPIRDPQWFALPSGDGGPVYARVSGLQYGRIAFPVPVAVALVDRTDGAVVRCASGTGDAQLAPLTPSSTQQVDVVAYFPQPYQDREDGLPDTLRLLLDHTSGAAPANDSLAAAKPITALPLHETVDTSLADDDTGGFQGCHWLPRRTAWWTYTAPAAGTLHLSATADLPAPPADVWPGPSIAVARLTDAGPVQVLPTVTDDCVTPVSAGDVQVEAGATYLIGAFVAEDPSFQSLVLGGRITLDVQRATTAPGAPTGTSVRAHRRARTATITWAPPADDGGSAVTGYRVTLQRTGVTGAQPRTRLVAATARSATFRHLTRGGTYRLTVQAVNAVGAGPTSGGTVRIPSPRGRG